MTEPRLCERCGLPDTRRSVTFDDAGICSVCRHHEIKHSSIDWAERERALAAIADEIRGRGPYDVVVSFGGGKDGSYVLYYLTRVLGLRCLAATIDNRFIRQQAWDNSRRVLDGLGVDQIVLRPPMPIVQRLMRAGLGLAGTVCWHCTAGIAAFPLRTAIRMGVPLVVYAHSVSEYYSYPGRTYADPPEADVMDDDWYKLTTGVSFERMTTALPDVDPRALAPFAFPSRDEIATAGVQTLFMSNYVLWDERRQVDVISRELGWQGASQEGVPAGHEYEKFDCYLVGTHDYLRFVKEGYGRGARIGSLEARLGRMTKDEAVALGRSSDGRRPASLDTVLNMLALDEEEFLDHAMEYAQPERDFDLEAVRRGPRLPDAEHMPGWRSDEREVPT